MVQLFSSWYLFCGLSGFMPLILIRVVAVVVVLFFFFFCCSFRDFPLHSNPHLPNSFICLPPPHEKLQLPHKLDQEDSCCLFFPPLFPHSNLTVIFTNVGMVSPEKSSILAVARMDSKLPLAPFFPFIHINNSHILTTTIHRPLVHRYLRVYHACEWNRPPAWNVFVTSYK